MSDQPGDPGPESPFHYHLELTPAQLKITHTALRSLLDDFGHDEGDVLQVIHEVLDKLPDDHAIRAIQLDREAERTGEPQQTLLTEVPVEADSGDDGVPPDAAA